MQMKAAIVEAAGMPPVYGDFPDPAPRAGERLVTVTAAAISHLVRMRASGRHYSSSGQLPFVVGFDGVGRLDDGRRVYFALPRVPYGAMAERTVVVASRCVELPDGLDDVTAAAIANPGMSSWAALTERARLQRGETVLINGATGTSGRLAVAVARHLGAAKVIATGRNAAVLDRLKTLGADAVVSLADGEEELESRFREQFAEGVDVVVDYLWGKSAEILLRSAARAMPAERRLRYVEVGAIGGAEIALPGAVLRSTAIELMGSGIGSIPLEHLIGVIGNLFHATGPAGFEIATQAAALCDVADAWSRDDSAARTVLTIDR